MLSMWIVVAWWGVVSWWFLSTLPETNRLTFSHLKMDGWKISMLLGPGLFSGANLLLVSGSVYICLSCMDARRMDFSGSWVDSQDRDSSVSVVAYFFCIRLIPIRIWNSDFKHENIQYAWLFLITIRYIFFDFLCIPEINISGQIIATSLDLTPNGGLVREIPLFQGNPGWWNIIIWPDIYVLFNSMSWFHLFNSLHPGNVWMQRMLRHEGVSRVLGSALPGVGFFLCRG